eukprot:scaffold6291_cov230-Isochrysis_galbana.AAC.1
MDAQLRLIGADSRALQGPRCCAVPPVRFLRRAPACRRPMRCLELLTSYSQSYVAYSQALLL